jgi:hypothetical protein
MSPRPKRLPSVKDPPLIKNAPIHDCPYTKDGVRFGLDNNEYDVCDDCHLSAACYKYKMKSLYPDKMVMPKAVYRRKK